MDDRELANLIESYLDAAQEVCLLGNKLEAARKVRVRSEFKLADRIRNEDIKGPITFKRRGSLYIINRNYGMLTINIQEVAKQI